MGEYFPSQRPKWARLMFTPVFKHPPLGELGVREIIGHPNNPPNLRGNRVQGQEIQLMILH